MWGEEKTTRRRIRGSGGGAGVADCGCGSSSRRSCGSGSGSGSGSSAIRIASIFGEKRPIMCVTEKHTKKAIPISERGLPESVWIGICQYSKSGSPRISLGFIPIWGPTYTSKTNSTSRRVSTRRVEWCKGCLCKFVRHVGQKHG